MSDNAVESSQVDVPLHDDTAAVISVIVGPVVGMVTDTEARVLVETQDDGELECTLTPPSGAAIVERKAFRAFRPLAFHFTGLAPSTPYRLELTNAVYSDDKSKPSGMVRTFSADQTTLRVISGSCDNAKNRGHVDMWERIAEYVDSDQVDLLVHNGDQVYADSAFKKGEAFAKEQPSSSNEEIIEKTTQYYAEIYRKTWAHPPTRKVLANVSNLCMWDDHEIRNDWGAFPKDRDPSTLNYTLGLAARRAYWLYQRQLWDTIDDVQALEATADKDGHCMLLPGGKLGLIFVDSRGSRSFYADEQRPFVSTAQWNMLDEAMGPNGLFKDTKRLMIVHTMPVVLVGTTCSEACPCVVGGKDKMGFGIYPQEQEEYLGLIDGWVHAQDHNGTREVILLGGDLHFSMESEVVRAKDGHQIFRQVVTSAISNKQPCLWQYYPMKWLANCFRRLGHGTYSYSHNKHNPVMNFGYFNMEVAKQITYDIVLSHETCCNTRGLLSC